MTSHHEASSSQSVELAQHADFLRSLARRLLQQEADAEDIVQETMAIALQAGPQKRTSLRPWLATVLGHRSRNRVRDRSRRAGRLTGESVDALPARETSSQGTLELSRILLEEVKELGEPYTETIVLRFYEGLPPRSIAARMDAPVATVQTRLARGLEILRKRLDRAHPGGRTAWMSAAAALVPGFPQAASLPPASAHAAPLKWASVAAVVMAAGWVGVRIAAPTVAGPSFPPLAAPESSSAIAAASLAAVDPTFNAPRAPGALSPTDPPAGPAIAQTLVITGRVLDLPIDAAPEDGAPAAEGVRVEYSAYYPEGPPSNPYGPSHARPAAGERPFVLTDASGRYRIEVERAGLTVIQVRCPQTAELRGFEWKARGDAIPDEESVSRDLLRYPHGTVEGVLVDLAGEPLAGKRIRLPRDEPGTNELFTEKVTDASGRFAFDHVTHLINLDVAEEGLSLASSPYAKRRDRGGWEPARIVAAPTGRLTLRCVDAHGQPAPVRNLWVSLMAEGNSAELNSYGFVDRFFPTGTGRNTDASGVAVFESIPAGVPLMAVAPQLGVQCLRHVDGLGASFSSQPEAEPIVIPLGGEVEVTLRAGRTFTVSGALTSAVGEPVEGLWVQVCDPLAVGTYYYRELQEIQTDSGGRFSATFHPASGVDYIVLQARDKSTGHTAARTLTLGSTAQISADLALTPPTLLGGTVRDAEGSPVEDARIIASLHDAEGRLVSMSLIGAKTDEGGAFPAQPISTEPSGSVLRVVSTHPSFRPAALECDPALAAALELRLTEALDAALTVHIDAGDTDVGKIKIGWATVRRSSANSDPLPALDESQMGPISASGISRVVRRFSSVPVTVGDDLHLRSVQEFAAPPELTSIALPSGPGWLAVSIEDAEGNLLNVQTTGLVEIPPGSSEVAVPVEL